ncbi:MAG TPA: bifunctional lysylphosphatidylglycerol flippase/synthetase MprF [Gemmatimonadaceae bacterium]|nr:bifunctional lysylphosphatidylglycerol flippase/synthetase MprF [Gemmatimonadaceae bacterium]
MTRSSLDSPAAPHVRRAGVERPPPGGQPTPAPATGRARRWAAPATAVIVGAVALITLHAELGALHYRALSAAVRAMPRESLLLAALATLVTYAVLPAYDALALRYVGKPLGARRTSLASIIAYGFSQTIGLAALTGASIRYRFWTAWGLSGAEVAQGVAFTTVTLWLGIATVAGVACLVGTPPPGSPLVFTAGALRTLGVVVLFIPVGYVVWSARSRRTVGIRGWSFPIPGARLALLQVGVGALDWLLSSLVLYALLAPLGVGLGTAVRVFVLGQVLGLVSHVPAGIGVFESVVLLALRPVLPGGVVLPALIAYRAVYYVAPLAVAALAFAGYEVTLRHRPIFAAVRTAGRWVPGTVPYFLSLTTFAAGMLLMLSAATPGVHARLRWLDAFFPLAVIEVSHFASSVAGVILILLANGLRRRLDAAYHLAVLALLVGIVGSLLKGADYEEALALVVVLAAVLPARPHFFRRAALTSEPLTPGWIAALTLSLLATAWLGLFSYGRIAYSNDLWWRFATVADAPRFLRAMAGITTVIIAFGLARWLRPVKQRFAPPSETDLARVKSVALHCPDVRAHLALLGDKSLLFSESGESFIMYGVSGRSWVALGDPLGQPSEHSELVWRFRELADRHGGWPVLYQVSRDMLPLCIDLGLTLLKLGEEAHVRLSRFCLEGGSRRGLRRTVNDVERTGATFEIVPPSQVASLMPELEAVSDDWLAAKRTREKGFSLGFFDADYLTNFPMAITRRDGAIVAFANVWSSEARHTASADLMRFSSAAPRGVMEYLFVKLMLWARDEGYEIFDLGMAPLSGFEHRTLAPAWHRLGSLVYRHGEHFYHFRGLRQYKEKFDPEWEPRYLAAPGGLAIPRILANVTALVSGGLAGVVRK